MSFTLSLYKMSVCYSPIKTVQHFTVLLLLITLPCIHELLYVFMIPQLGISLGLSAFETLTTGPSK